ncbi:hypothetical protein NF865_02140 [Thermococcus aggregans]|uniref:Uncharacterized protein n=1 Tax=Thermococcus aggregans TaxID=110163 RepID=A0A9E7MY27_THEAG|nr:hypothetical protein [Thermococcus aggregans]USS41039.1 hypothetical protein NF865_02140 [Thermococcus aggregans]
MAETKIRCPKWALFERAKQEVGLTEEDLEVLERIKEKTWKERKKKYGL